MSIKAALSPFVHAVSFASGRSAKLAKRQLGLRVLMYHNIGGAELSTKNFRAGLHYLQHNFSVLPLATLIKKLQQHQPIAGDEVALTFDDGYRNLLTTAVPILQEFKLPATFFVCPGLIENRQWLWIQDIRERLGMISPVQLDHFAAEQGWPNLDSEQLISRMKQLPHPQRLAQCERIRERTKNFLPSKTQHLEFDLMNWDELSALDPALITIGSHSANHPILSTLAPEEITAEIIGSRQTLEKRLGRPVEFFCYPNGEYSAPVVEIVRRTYTAAVTTESRAVGPNDDLHLLPRISAAGAPSLLAWRMYRPSA